MAGWEQIFKITSYVKKPDFYISIQPSQSAMDNKPILVRREFFFFTWLDGY